MPAKLETRIRLRRLRRLFTRKSHNVKPDGTLFIAKIVAHARKVAGLIVSRCAEMRSRVSHFATWR